MIDQYKDSMDKTVLNFAENIKAIRTGRVGSDFLNGVSVNAYGSRVLLPQAANVSVMDSTRISVSVFDTSLVKDVLKAIQESNLVSNPVANGNVIMASIPPMTTERREELKKGLHKTLEDYKVRIRNIRKDWKSEIDTAEKDKEISEDMAKKMLDEMQKQTDNSIKKLEEIAAKKEQELSAI
jgi:ribosome recycling factor